MTALSKLYKNFIKRLYFSMFLKEHSDIFNYTLIEVLYAFKRSSLIRNTSARHECDRSDTSVTRAAPVRHEWNTSTTQTTRVWLESKILILITTGTKKNFTPLYLLYGKWKITRRETISFQEIPFGNVLFPCQNMFEKCTRKTELFNGIRYIKKLYTRL